MLEELVHIHNQVIASTPRHFKRYLNSQINWKAQGICIYGDRGVGKTTLMCQDLIERYETPDNALYLSADNVNVISYGLVPIATRFFAYGGKALYVDKVHKYPDWSVAIKNLLDTYKTKQIIISASSSLDLNKSKADLSRRMIYHKLQGLSFREYLQLALNFESPVYSFTELLEKHVKIAGLFNSLPILKHFHEYLRYGYYPFFMEGVEDYLAKVNNVIEKVIFEDIAVVYNLRQTTLPVLKRLLWLVATSNGLIPNIDKISKNLGISREVVYNCFTYLSNSGLLTELFSVGKGNALIRKPAKILLNNSNLLAAINGSLKLEGEIGGVREIFFVNQVGVNQKITFHDKGDFLIDDQYVVEVGGKGKTDKQIRGENEAYLAVDDTVIGFGKKIPLYLFGLLY